MGGIQSITLSDTASITTTGTEHHTFQVRGKEGNGGTAITQNFGTVYTFGSGAHGILAQSIGGNGSSSGTAGGIVALGGQAG